MDFTHNETQDDVRGLARSIFAERARPERVREIEDAVRFDRDLWDELAKADLLGICLPEEVGGSGHTIMELGVLLEEMGRHVAPVPLLSTLGLAAMPIAVLGDDDQRKRLLAPVVEGSILTAALQEQGADPLDPTTTATKDGSRWRLDGVKVAVPHATLAERILVSAITSEGAGLFVLDPGASGVGVEATRSTHREPQANITLDGATADEAVGIGDEAIRTAYRYAVASMCAVGVGVFDEAVRITASYISEREQFGKPIAAFQGATLLAADAYIDTEATRITTWSAIWRLAQGLPCDEELAIAKFWLADGGQRVVHSCQHLHGGMGVDIDYPIHRYFLWAKQLELTLGGTHAQLKRIGAAVAGEEV